VTVTAVLVLASRAGSGAVSLGMEFCRRAGAEADLVWAGGDSLPAGAWRQAWRAGALTGAQAADVLGQTVSGASYDLVLLDDGDGGRELAPGWQPASTCPSSRRLSPFAPIRRECASRAASKAERERL